jgi:hypothetical protein
MALYPRRKRNVPLAFETATVAGMTKRPEAARSASVGAVLWARSRRKIENTAAAIQKGGRPRHDGGVYRAPGERGDRGVRRAVARSSVAEAERKRRRASSQIIVSVTARGPERPGGARRRSGGGPRDAGPSGWRSWRSRRARPGEAAARASPKEQQEAEKQRPGCASERSDPKSPRHAVAHRRFSSASSCGERRRVRFEFRTSDPDGKSREENANDQKKADPPRPGLVYAGRGAARGQL